MPWGCKWPKSFGRRDHGPGRCASGPEEKRVIPREFVGLQKDFMGFNWCIYIYMWWVFNMIWWKLICFFTFLIGFNGLYGDLMGVYQFMVISWGLNVDLTVRLKHQVWNIGIFHRQTESKIRIEWEANRNRWNLNSYYININQNRILIK